ncbi:MAG: molybdenum cofactor biosynthesis protein MoaB [Planctomycetales bacterium]|nr:molybdenum cofactor biosynthesis protein MoaB [Planctomycetales bacterium]
MTDAPSAPESHRRDAPASVACGVVTVSDTRTRNDDRSGDLIVELLERTGHSVAAREIVPDEAKQVTKLLKRLAGDKSIQAILITGGTGVAPRDQTPEAVAALLTKELSGFGELFRVLSYAEIGAAAMLSRATAGLIDRTVVFLMPGSTAAVKLAVEQLVLPELAHVTSLAAK